LVLPKQLKEDEINEEIRPIIINLGSGVNPDEI
jgi:hypothetical protein